MSKHTPGEWEVDGSLADGPKVVAFPILDEGPQEVIVADMDVDGAIPADVRWANARLIAAAPEMYELLRSFAAAVVVTEHAGTVAGQRKARALLAKIDGE